MLGMFRAITSISNTFEQAAYDQQAAIKHQ
jgi:hypothetical protein